MKIIFSFKSIWIGMLLCFIYSTNWAHNPSIRYIHVEDLESGRVKISYRTSAIAALDEEHHEADSGETNFIKEIKIYVDGEEISNPIKTHFLGNSYDLLDIPAPEKIQFRLPNNLESKNAVLVYNLDQYHFFRHKNNFSITISNSNNKGWQLEETSNETSANTLTFGFLFSLLLLIPGLFFYHNNYLQK